MSNNRKRGHDLERQIARDLIPFFKYTKTARASSKLLDDCGIDINFVPFLIQCKRGYEKARPKFEKEHSNIKENLSKNFPKDHPINDMPIILVHKLNPGKGNNDREELTQVTMSYDLFIKLLEFSQHEFHKWPILSL